MRAIVLLLCFGLAGCFANYEIPVISPPEPAKAVAGAQRAFFEEKLVGAWEISAVREAHPISPGPYMLCIRGTSSAGEPARTYAVFFKNNDYAGSRLSVIIDQCETQVFRVAG